MMQISVYFLYLIGQLIKNLLTLCDINGIIYVNKS